MKQILVMCAVAIAASCFTSCKDTNKGKLDPSAKVYINATKVSQAVISKVVGKTLTPLEIVKQSEAIYTSGWHLGVGEWNRDTVNTRFIVGSDWAISDRGELELGFIEARNYAFVTLDAYNNPKDTIAYIPNEIMQAAETAIKAAYDAENYPECYRLLQEAFVFTPSPDVE